MLRQVNLKIAAGVEEVIALKGNYVRIKSAPYDLQVRNATDSVNDSFLMSEGDSANFGEGFERLSFKNMGSGDTVFSVIIGKNSGVDSSKVGGTVQVQNGEIVRVKAGQCFVGVFSTAGVAGQYANAQLKNISANKNIILTQLVCHNSLSTYSNIGLALTNSIDLANLNSASQNKKNKLANAPDSVSTQVRTGTNVARLIGGINIYPFNNLYLPLVKFNEPLIIPPSYSVLVGNDTLGESLIGSFDWYEESI